MKPNAEQLKGVVRTLLAAFAGYMAAKGKTIPLLSDPGIVEALSGTVVALVAGWSVSAKRKGKS